MPKNRLWGASGVALGGLGGPLGVPMAPSWGSLGRSWGNLEAAEAHQKRNGEKLKTNENTLGV